MTLFNAYLEITKLNFCGRHSMVRKQLETRKLDHYFKNMLNWCCHSKFMCPQRHFL